jgi:hypothetical protein
MEECGTPCRTLPPQMGSHSRNFNGLDKMSLPSSLNQIPLPQKLPPLVLTAFTRADLLEDVLQGISQQSLIPPQILAFVDGPRHERDLPLIADTIALLEKFSSIIPVKVKKRDQNLGCDQNVLQAFTEILSIDDSLVYLEDDDRPNPYFYDRLCRLLEAYRDHKAVFSVSAYASFPGAVYPFLNKDFEVSNRVFSWGFGIWADRWHDINLLHKSPQHNPFGQFYKIPANPQTKMTLVNQFWLEKNQKTDWVITMTIAALHQGRFHIIPTKSFVYNTGFGHPESKTYRGKEGAWVNSRYDESFCPNSLPSSLDLKEPLSTQLTGVELAQHFVNKGVWLTPLSLIYLLKQYPSYQSVVAFIRLFMMRFMIVLRRLKGGLRV